MCMGEVWREVRSTDIYESQLLSSQLSKSIVYRSLSLLATATINKIDNLFRLWVQLFWAHDI